MQLYTVTYIYEENGHTCAIYAIALRGNQVCRYDSLLLLLININESSLNWISEI